MPFFFFSYACANAQDKANSYVSKLFDSLEFELQQKAQPPIDGPIGFRDWDHIDTGDDLPQNLIDALQTCKVFVPLFTPLYFTRAACGKEWHAFRGRLLAHRPRELPPLILPVWWAPVDFAPFNLSDAVTSIKYTHNPEDDGTGRHHQFAEKYVKHGLLQILQHNDEANFTLFVTSFAKRMRDACQAHRLADAQGFEWNKLPNAFQPKVANPVAPPRIGPRHVQVFIAAGNAPDFANEPARQGSYGETPFDWHPFRPPMEGSIGLMVQRAANDLEILSHLVEVQPGLCQKLLTAQNEQSIVVLIIDPWSLDVGAIADELREYDGRDFWNCTAFVAWNDDDPETQRRREDLQKRVRTVLKTKTVTGVETSAFRNDIQSKKKFETDLRSALVRIQQRILQLGTVERKAVGEADIALSQVQGPGSTSST